MDRTIFERYLDFRFQKEGALTPGQKLEVIARLKEEARQGRVPSGEKAVVSLPVEHPAVAAVLRGEEVSLGAAAIRRAGTDWRDVTTWPLAARIGVLVGIMALSLLMAMRGMAKGQGKAEATATPTAMATATVEASATPDWYATMTALAPTSAPPPTATATQAPFLLGTGGPAENSRDPASIEIAGRLFVVSAGEVKDGQWIPDGPQWLKGTEVRRVFAIPYASLADAPIQAGDPIYVRTRGGQVITYRVRDVVRLLANQIESFVSLRPSLVVALPMSGGDVQSSERVMLFGEADVSVVEQAAAEYVPNAFTLGDTNLRTDPGLKSTVLMGMPRGTPLIVSAAPPVTMDGHVWVYVLSPYGYGWAAKDMLFIQQ
jgi:hypothetical protein